MKFNDFDNLDVITGGEFSTMAQVQRTRSSSSTTGDASASRVDSATADIAQLSGIFDENYADSFDLYGDSQQSGGRNFCFQAQTNDLIGLRNGDRLTIHGKNYQITTVKPMHDGKLTHLILKQDFS